jgi:hypothetical protein
MSAGELLSVAIEVLVGFILVLLGRQLYWVFVGGAGFAAATALSLRLLQGQPAWLMLVIGLGAGLVGALLAVFMQRLAIGIAGFLAGGYVLASVVPVVIAGPEWLSWVSFLVGGVLGVVLVALLFDWALIALSSLAGAVLAVQAFQLETIPEVLVFAGLVILGMVVQARSMSTEHRKRSSAA